MEYLVYTIGFFVGASLISFYVTLGERILRFFYGLERKGLILKQKIYKILFLPSSCNQCGKRIGTLHLIPVFGYFFSSQKCPECKSQIPFYYPVSEFMGGLVFFYSYLVFKNWFLSICLLVLFGHLLISIYTDSKKYSLDYENYPFILLSGLGFNHILTGVFFPKESFFVFIGFFLFYILIYFIYKRGIGLGDVFFAPILGFICGHPWWILYFNISYISAVAFTILLRDKGKSLKGARIPMGAYLAFGTMITFLAKIYYYKGF
ncbi:MAG: prepilin peptidase [Leptospiraceae bacterium]|nr:prepilin peptidase [Leptospiraceae bacterium]